MIQLIKAELEYFGIIYLIPFLLFAEWIITVFFNEYLTVFTSVLFIMIVYFLAMIHEKETIKTDRIHIRLPISAQNIAIARAVVIILPWLFFAGFSLIINTLSHPAQMDRILIATAWTGIFIPLMASYIIIKDIFKSVARMNLLMKGIISTLVFGATLLVIYFCVLIDPKFREGIILYIIYPWGVLLVLVTIFSFSKRNNYT